MGDDSDEVAAPPDSQLDPSSSPGFGIANDWLDDIDVGRDVTLGEASPEELTVGDVSSLAENSVDELTATLSDGSIVERRRAALALGDRDPGPAVRDALAAAATDDEDADVRQFAIESLAALGGENAAAVPVALDLIEDEDPWVRAEAVVALDRLDRAGHEDRLIAALDDVHHAVRRNAAISLFKHRGESLLPELLDLLNDPEGRVREWAAHLLGGVDADRARAALERMAETDESHVVRATARRARTIDADRFRWEFARSAGAKVQPRPGADRLNHQPDL